tara:strand:+ start:404 stop:529 length:126 start_codon:yes stop_codon:yes gene_type:complete
MKMEKIIVEIIHKVDGKIVVENVNDVIKRETTIAVAHAGVK